jgi:hypothetical protein
MVEFKSKSIPVKVDRREHPRLEFRCPVMVGTVPGFRRITDLSLGGVFIEVSPSDGLQMDQLIDLSIRFPTEQTATRIRAQVVAVKPTGIGCMFVDLTDEQREIVRNCFETFKDTLPID